MFKQKIKTILILIIYSATTIVSCQNKEEINKSPSSEKRIKYNFNPDWKFIKETLKTQRI